MKAVTKDEMRWDTNTWNYLTLYKQLINNKLNY